MSYNVHKTSQLRNVMVSLIYYATISEEIRKYSFCLPENSAKLALEWYIRHPNQDKHKLQQAIKT